MYPETQDWNRSDFLSARRRQTEAAKKVPARTGFTRIVIDAGDEIICDFCSDGIDDETIHLVRRGKSVACNKCFKEKF